MVTDVLARNVKKDMLTKRFNRLTIKRSSTIHTSIFFANDALFIRAVTSENCVVLMKCINNYYQAINHLVN